MAYLERRGEDELTRRPTIVLFQKQSHLPNDKANRYQKPQVKPHEKKVQTRRGSNQTGKETKKANYIINQKSLSQNLN